MIRRIESVTARSSFTIGLGLPALGTLQFPVKAQSERCHTPRHFRRRVGELPIAWGKLACLPLFPHCLEKLGKEAKIRERTPDFGFSERSGRLIECSAVEEAVLQNEPVRTEGFCFLRLKNREECLSVDA